MNQLRLNLYPIPEIRYTTNRIRRMQETARDAVDDIKWMLHVQQICEEHDRDELDRYAMGFDAAILREDREEYRSNWCEHYREQANEYREKWYECLRENGRLQARLEIAETKVREMHEQEKRDKEEFDRLMDDMEAELLTPDVLEALQNA